MSGETIFLIITTIAIILAIVVICFVMRNGDKKIGKLRKVKPYHIGKRIW